MPPDTAGPSAAAAQAVDALAWASAALCELEARGEGIDFQAVARAAGVSRQWLYKQPQLRAEIERLRANQPIRDDTAVPTRERSTEGSLRQRLRTLLTENVRLREANAELRRELALAYGRQRELSLPSDNLPAANPAESS